MTVTFGRFPTYSEVREYYTRDDILRSICEAAAVRKVILSFGDEPSIYSEGGSPPLGLMGVDELREYVIQRFAEKLPEKTYPYEKALGAYPSLHFITKGGDGEPWDFIMETDSYGWRRSFVDVRGAAELLHDYRVPFMIKFSGHRSLHLIIPQEAFPDAFRDQPIGRIWSKLEGELRQFFSKYALVRWAHGTGGILRLPYSLNENTGMVSLPIHCEELDTFRPWESFHHLVKVREEFSFGGFIQRCKEESGNTADFLNAALDGESIPRLSRRIWSFSLAARQEHAQINTEKPMGEAEAAWRDMVSGSKPSDEIVRNYRNEDNPDIRWFIAKSLIGDERSSALLPEADEYALCAIEDSITYQANASISRFFEKFLKLSDYHSIGGLHRILERVEPEGLKQELLHRSEVSSEGELRQLIRFSSIIGSASSEWALSELVIERALERFPGLLDEMEQKVLEAAKGLEARDIAEIRKAQRVLIEAGKKATDQIILTMTSGKPRVRKRAMEVISKLKDPAFAECLVSALGDENGKVRRMAVSAVRRMAASTLIGFGDKTTALLEDAANADNPVLSANAVRILGIVQGEGSLGTAIAALESTNTKVKSAAVKALGRIDDERAREALKSALWDVSADVGVKAAGTLADSGEVGLNILKDALAEAESEGETQAARCIAHGLAEFGDDSGLDHLVSALYDESWHQWSTPWLIAELRNPRGNDAMLDFFERYIIESEGTVTSEVRFAMRALSKVADRRAIPLVKECLAKQKDRKVLKTGVDTLRIRAVESKEKESIQALIDVVQGDNYPLAQSAAGALTKIGEEALPEIQEAHTKMEHGTKSEKLLNSVILRLSKNED